MTQQPRFKSYGFALGVGVLLAACGAAPTPAASTDSQAPVIQVEAHKFAFSPEVIQVERGKTVVLELHSSDVVHGFNIPELGVRADVKPGQVTRVKLTPASAGTFQIHCDVFCGEGHESMTGQLIVSP